MLVIRYLNGKRLHGAMPPLVLDSEGVGALVSPTRQDLPLPAPFPSAILNAEGGDFGRELI